MSVDSNPSGNRLLQSRTGRRTIGIITSLAACALLMGTVSECDTSSSPSSDSTPPKIYILKWERNAQGGRGDQTTVQPGGQFEVPSNWLSPNGADIRVYANDNEGNSWFTLTGEVSGAHCSTIPDPNGTFYQKSGLTGKFPQQTKNAPSGSVTKSIGFHIDKLISDQTSCGIRQYSGMPQAREFWASSGTWKITATAENCCGGRTTATFTIIV